MMEMKKILLLAGAVAITAVLGCVSIDQNVQVTPPNAVEPYGRSPIDQCTPHTVPHRFIMSTASYAVSLFQNGGANNLVDQQGFDQNWAQISPQLDQNQVISSNLKPVIDWTAEGAYYVVIPMTDSCTRAKPYGEGMTSDCYTVSIPIYLYQDNDCKSQTASSALVFWYIYPKTNLPVNVQWIRPTPTPTAIPVPTPLPTPTPLPKSGDE